MKTLQANLITGLVFCMLTVANAQIGIGTITPLSSATLDIESTTQGVLPPRMTSAQRDALAVSMTSKGLLIFNNDTSRLNVFDGVRWHAIANNQSVLVCPNAATFAEFLDCLQSNYTPTQTLGYGVARDMLYSQIDINTTTQELSCIYTNYTILMDYSTDPDPSVHAFNLGINAEHAFPQSMGASNEPALSDMYNIFACKVEANSSRSNCPFGDIVDTDTEIWYYELQELTSVPTSNIDWYSEKDNEATYPTLAASQQCTFEPRESKKGDVARAIFYFYAVYHSTNINGYISYADTDFFEAMKTTLLQWHQADPVDQLEIDRNNAIKLQQGNDNPFILDATLAVRMYN